MGSCPSAGILRLVHQSVQLTQNLGGLIYSAGQLISVDKKYQVAWRLSPVVNTDGNNQDKIADEFGATFDGSSYKVVSFINTVSLTQLRFSLWDNAHMDPKPLPSSTGEPS